MEDHLLTDEQIAELAQVSVNTVRYWRVTGLLPFIKIGRHPRVWYSTFCKVFQKPEGNFGRINAALGVVEASHVSTKR